MKQLLNTLVANLHWIILVSSLYSVYEQYEAHNMQMEEITGRISNLQADITKTKKKIAEIQEFSKKTEEYKVRVEDVAKNIETVQKQLPSEINDSQILSTFQNEINVLNIKDANFTPGKEETSTYFISKEYSLNAKGTFLQFLVLFERIGNADRIFNIKQLKLTSIDDGQKGRFQMISGSGTIQAYRYNPQFKVDRGF